MLVQRLDQLLVRHVKNLCLQKRLCVSTLRKYLTLRLYLNHVHTHYFKDCKRSTTAQFLIEHALAKEFQKNAVNDNDEIGENELNAILAMAEKRIVQRIPFEYLTNEAEYLGRTFYVDNRVLIPRSLMNTRFSDFLREARWTNHKVLDLCTGSGCVGITLALMDPRLYVDLSDLSDDALEVAQKNIQRFGLMDRVRCIKSDLFNEIDDTYDLIVTNPPYVSTRDVNGSPKEFKHEPRMALEAQDEGMALVNRIIVEAARYLMGRCWMRRWAPAKVKARANTVCFGG